MAHNLAKNSFGLTIDNWTIFAEIEVLNPLRLTNADDTTE